MYPVKEVFHQQMLKVSEIHDIYFEQYGNPEGIPVLFVHGGPGGGIHPDCRSFFNPDKYNVILFDQRACGKSTPFACLEENTTWDLISDMEKIREHLKIENWILFGGSWGSTLSLSYAIKHATRVKALVLRGIFTLREKEVQWFYQDGCSKLFPDAWEKYIEPIPPEERDDFVSAFYKRLKSEDQQIRSQAAKAWSIWEGTTANLITDPKSIEKSAEDSFADAFARIECHYFSNKGFFEEDAWILNNLNKIQNIPCEIVQGRYDVICPAETAWELHRGLKNSKLHIIQDAGHSAFETGIRKKLVQIMDEYTE